MWRLCFKMLMLKFCQYPRNYIFSNNSNLDLFFKLYSHIKKSVRQFTNFKIVSVSPLAGSTMGSCVLFLGQVFCVAGC